MHKTIVLAAAIAVGCAGVPERRALQSRELCVLDQLQEWSLLAKSPAHAKGLVSLANAHPVFPKSSTSPPIADWFRSEDDALLLCRHDNAGCIGEWWIFRLDTQEWKIEKSDGWVCVT